MNESKLVKAEGPTSAHIVIIGEAPGIEEEACGRPFVGASGRLLTKMLIHAGLSRNECYITNLLKWRPPNNDITQVPKEKLEEARHLLHDELSGLPNVKIYIPLGNKALWGVCGVEAIFKHRGYPMTAWNGKVAIPTVHPAATFRQSGLMAFLALDLLRVKEALTRLAKGPLSPKREYILSPPTSVLECWIDNAIEAKLPVSFDIETSNNVPTAIGFANNLETAISVPFTSNIVYTVNRLLSDPTVPKIGQQFFYDTIMLERAVGIRVAGIWLDTLILHSVLEPELPHSLEFLASQYTWEPYFKDSSHENLYLYNAKDAIVTLECAQVMLQHLEEDPIAKEIYFNQKMRLWHTLYRMCLKGIRVDQVARKEFQTWLSVESTRLQRQLDSVARRPLNVNSNQQLSAYLCGHLRLRAVMSRKSGRRSFDANALDQLAINYPTVKEIELIKDLRGLKKLESTYVSAEIESDGRTRTAYNQAIETGRLSSRKSPWGTGLNLQNLPHVTKDGGKTRRMFIPDEGKLLVEADYVQAQLTAIAYLSFCQPLIDILLAGEDVHQQVAAICFEKPAETITDKERTLIKRIVYGTLFGMGIASVARTAGVSRQAAQETLDKFYFQFPELKLFPQMVMLKLEQDRTLVDPFGGKRYFYGRLDDETLREALAHLPQAIEAKLTNQSLYEAWAMGLDVLIQNHDAILFQTTESEVINNARQLKAIMERPFKIGPNSVIIRAKFKVGPNWADMEKLNLNEKEL